MTAVATTATQQRVSSVSPATAGVVERVSEAAEVEAKTPLTNDKVCSERVREREREREREKERGRDENMKTGSVQATTLLVPAPPMAVVAAATAGVVERVSEAAEVEAKPPLTNDKVCSESEREKRTKT